jgi:hypothetical protein
MGMERYVDRCAAEDEDREEPEHRLRGPGQTETEGQEELRLLVWRVLKLSKVLA